MSDDANHLYHRTVLENETKIVYQDLEKGKGVFVGGMDWRSIFHIDISRNEENET